MQVIPLLQEYFFDDWSRIGLVLSARSGRSPFLRTETLRAGELFGDQADVGAQERTRHALTAPASWTAEAFRSLYEPADPLG